MLSVLTLWSTGVAKPRLIGRTELSAVRLRSAWWRLRANRLEAMAVREKNVRVQMRNNFEKCEG